MRWTNGEVKTVRGVDVNQIVRMKVLTQRVKMTPNIIYLVFVIQIILKCECSLLCKIHFLILLSLANLIPFADHHLPVAKKLLLCPNNHAFSLFRMSMFTHRCVLSFYKHFLLPFLYIVEEYLGHPFTHLHLCC